MPSVTLVHRASGEASCCPRCSLFPLRGFSGATWAGVGFWAPDVGAPTSPQKETFTLENALLCLVKCFLWLEVSFDIRIVTSAFKNPVSFLIILVVF